MLNCVAVSAVVREHPSKVSVRQPFVWELRNERNQPLRCQWNPIVRDQLNNLADGLKDLWVRSFRRLLLTKNSLEDGIHIPQLPRVIEGLFEFFLAQ